MAELLNFINSCKLFYGILCCTVNSKGSATYMISVHQSYFKRTDGRTDDIRWHYAVDVAGLYISSVIRPVVADCRRSLMSFFIFFPLLLSSASCLFFLPAS